MAVAVSNILVTPPTSLVSTGSVLFDISGVSGGVSVELYLYPTAPARPPFYPVSPCTSGYTGLPPGRYVLFVGFYGSPVSTTQVEFTIPAYVAPPETTTVPAGPVAAHLPVLCVIEAAPTGSPLAPSALLLVVEVYRGAWIEAGRLRGVCDPTSGTARFDLSEYLKTQFSPTPPDESGANDPALAIPYRVRYGRASSFTGTAGEEAGTFAGLAVNAAEVLNPTGASLPVPLGPVPPYALVPTGYARFRSTLDATGVKNVATVTAGAACAARQFVWLHPSGAWVWGLFAGKHEHGTETTDDVVVRRAKGEDYYIGGGDVRDTLRVYSDKLDWPTFQVLRTLRRSRRVYERLDTGLYVPVLVEKGSFPDYQETDKLFEVNFTARYPVQTVQTF